MTDVGPARRRTLAEKIDRLFQTVHPADGEYTHEEVASAIREAGGPTISGSYLWQLRKGVRDNPTMRHLEALSEFFGVPPAYFFDERRDCTDRRRALAPGILARFLGPPGCTSGFGLVSREH